MISHRQQSLRQKVRSVLQKIVPDWLGLFPWYPPEEDTSSSFVHVARYDHEHDQCYLVYYTHQDTHMDILLNGVQASIVAYKISCPHTLQKPLMRHQVWVALEGQQGSLRVHMQEKNIALQMQENTYDSLDCHILRAAFSLPRVPFFAKKYEKAWLLIDRAHVADDNAEHLYRYIQKHHPEQPIYFALQKNCSDWARLTAENFNLIDVNSFTFKWILKYCQLIASSHMDIFLLENTYAHSTKARKKHIHLRHGVSNIDQSNWYNNSEASIDLLTSTIFDEYADTVNPKSPYNYTTKEAQLLGLTRHDALAPYIQKHNKTLLIMPTWRRYLSTYTDAASLSQTTYMQHWNALLNSETLQQLASQHGLQIIFYLHNNAQHIANAFTLPSHVALASQNSKTIQEHFKDATVMITDYSSVFFEMAFLEKAVLYYQFDLEDYYSTHWARSYFSFEKHGFGPIAAEQEELLVYLEQILSQKIVSEPYLSRMKNSFAFKDGQNCARTYKAITQLFQSQKNSLLSSEK